jgi:GTP-binding protein
MTYKDAVNESLRNIAIIAIADHGKTALVDAMFRKNGVFREGRRLRMALSLWWMLL